LAVRSGNINFVELLLYADPKMLKMINSVNSSFESPLYLAVANNQLDIAEVLLSYGARVS